INANSTITSSGGPVEVIGIEGAGGAGKLGIQIRDNATLTTAENEGDLRLVADRIDIQSTASVSTKFDHSVVLAAYSTDKANDLGVVGDQKDGPLSLTDNELDLITTGTLIIGNEESGSVTVIGNITRHVATEIELYSKNGINFLSG